MPRCKICKDLFAAFKDLIEDLANSDKEVLAFAKSLIPEREVEVEKIKEMLFSFRPHIAEEVASFLFAKYRKQKKASCLV